MTDDDDFVDLPGAGGRNETLGAAFDRPVEARRLAARERAQMRPMTIDLHHEPAVGEKAQQGEDRKRTCDTERQRRRYRKAVSHRDVGGERAAAQRQHDPPDQHHLEIHQHEAELP